MTFLVSAVWFVLYIYEYLFNLDQRRILEIPFFWKKFDCFVFVIHRCTEHTSLTLKQLGMRKWKAASVNIRVSPV